jgi:hypothetical protein
VTRPAVAIQITDTKKRRPEPPLGSSRENIRAVAPRGPHGLPLELVGPAPGARAEAAGDHALPVAGRLTYIKTQKEHSP